MRRRLPRTGTSSRRRSICTTSSSASSSGAVRPPISAAAAAARSPGSTPTAFRPRASMPPTACWRKRAGDIRTSHSRMRNCRICAASRPAAYDNVLCETVIMHLDRALIAPSVRRMLDIVKPGGMFYLSWRVTEAPMSATRMAGSMPRSMPRWCGRNCRRRRCCSTKKWSAPPRARQFIVWWCEKRLGHRSLRAGTGNAASEARQSASRRDAARGALLG